MSNTPAKTRYPPFEIRMMPSRSYRARVKLTKNPVLAPTRTRAKFVEKTPKSKEAFQSNLSRALVVGVSMVRLKASRVFATRQSHHSKIKSLLQPKRAMTSLFRLKVSTDKSRSKLMRRVW